MQIQGATGLGATELIKLTFGFWPSVGETIVEGVFLCLLSLGPLAGCAEIDDFSHALSGLSSDARVAFSAEADRLFIPN
jgi:hypothetical protein